MHSQVPEKLARCRPLTDTIRLAELFVKANLAFTALIMLGSAVVSGLTQRWDAGGLVLVLVIVLFGLLLGLPLLKAVMLVLRETGKPQQLCLFLRAFRSDKTSDQLRAWLKASLGTEFKLSGIRPPKERASALLTFVSPLLTGLRYAGSRQFELEAPDRNWMARLLASFAEARFVFVDVRDVTPHVLDEVRLAWSVFGEQRTIFIIDDTRSRDDWQEWINSRLGGENTNAAPVELKMLEWPEKRQLPPAEFVTAVQDLLQSIPPGKPGVNEAAVAFVETKVQPADWPIAPLERPWAFVIVSIVVLNLAGWLLMQFTPVQPVWINVAFFAAIQILFWRAWNRARKQRNFAVQINPAGPPSRGRLTAAGLLMLVPIALIGLLIVPMSFATRMVVNKATVVRTQVTMRSVIVGISGYSVEYNRLPVSPDRAGTGTDDGEIMRTDGSDGAMDTIAVLMAQTGGEMPNMNPRDVRFVDLPEAKAGVNGVIPLEGGGVKLVDAWGEPYYLQFDHDYDEQIANPDKANTDPKISSHAPVTLPGRAVMFSSGPDKKPHTADDITSWR